MWSENLGPAPGQSGRRVETSNGAIPSSVLKQNRLMIKELYIIRALTSSIGVLGTVLPQAALSHHGK